MIWKILLTLLLSALGGLLYHLGGLGAGGAKKYPKLPNWLFARQWRQFGTTLLAIASLLLWWHPINFKNWMMLILSYGLSTGAITTYWKKKDTNALWYHWFLHGFMLGLSYFFLYWAGIHWYGILTRSLISGLLMMWISERTRKPWLEENIRGAVHVGTTFLISIFP